MESEFRLTEQPPQSCLDLTALHFQAFLSDTQIHTHTHTHTHSDIFCPCVIQAWAVELAPLLACCSSALLSGRLMAVWRDLFVCVCVCVCVHVCLNMHTVSHKG